MNLILIYIVVVAIFASFPLILDICMAYWSRHKTLELLINKAAKDEFKLSELKELVKQSAEPPPGIPGLARSMMALTVIVVLGIAVFRILTVGMAGDASQNINSQIINNVLSMLAGLLAAITGFYFGGRAVESGKAAEKEKR
jgi:hypothetical protein